MLLDSVLKYNEKCKEIKYYANVLIGIKTFKKSSYILLKKLFNSRVKNLIESFSKLIEKCVFQANLDCLLNFHIQLKVQFIKKNIQKYFNSLNAVSNYPPQ